MKKIIALLLFALAVGACTTDFNFEDGIDDNNSEYANGLDTIQGIDESMYASARIFPGLVDTTSEVRIDTVITIDLSKSYAAARDMELYSSYSGSRFNNVMPLPIYSTGVYAGAGELVNITLPADAGYAITAQIGMQTSDLGTGSKLRQPIVYMQKQLRPGENKLRFPLGGYIWLIRDTKYEGSAEFKVRINGGVYASHDYIIGSTDAEKWIEELKKTTVPWLDMRGRRVALSVNRSVILSMAEADRNFTKNLDRCLDFWDKAVGYHYMQVGLRLNDENRKNRVPYFHDRFIFDVALAKNKLITNEYNQGIMLLQTSTFHNELLSLDTIKHNKEYKVFGVVKDKYISFYPPYNSTWTTAATKVPLFRLNEEMYKRGEIEKLSDFDIGLNTYGKYALDYASADSIKELGYDKWLPSSIKFTNSTNMMRLLQLIQLAKYNAKYNGGDEDGWSYLYDLAKESRFLKELNGTDNDFFLTLCNYFKVNLATFYDNWGVRLSDAVRAYAGRFPPLKNEIWKINPLDKHDPYRNVGSVKGRFHYRIDRGEWKILATYAANYGDPNIDDDYEKEDNYRKAEYLIDNSLGTYWASHRKDDDSEYPLPYYIIIDLGTSRDLDGVYYGNGSSRCVSGFTVQTLDDQGEIELAETKDSPWKHWGNVVQTLESSKIHEQFVPLSRRRARYLRLVFDRKNLYIRPDETLRPESAAYFDSKHKSRYQRLAEFGVWHY